MQRQIHRSISIALSTFQFVPSQHQSNKVGESVWPQSGPPRLSPQAIHQCAAGALTSSHRDLFHSMPFLFSQTLAFASLPHVAQQHPSSGILSIQGGKDTASRIVCTFRFHPRRCPPHRRLFFLTIAIHPARHCQLLLASPCVYVYIHTSSRPQYIRICIHIQVPIPALLSFIWLAWSRRYTSSFADARVLPMFPTFGLKDGHGGILPRLHF